ncbi:DUF2306 domain-containing protein [Roseibium polysiphoniae]|nr:DUF2306 domain-containing protein [Roseibium polysiphoniae]
MSIGSRSFMVLAWIAAVLCVLVALASYRFVPLGVQASMDFLAHHLPDNRWFLYAHIAVAPLALALLPVQLNGRLRKRYPKLHRWAGRFYVLLITLSGVAALQLAATTQAGPVAAAGFALLGVIWLIVTGLGFLTGWKRDFVQHRRWMVRSAALTFAAVTLRVYLALSMVLGLPFEPAYTAIAWLCWVPNLIVAEIYLRGGSRMNQRVTPIA